MEPARFDDSEGRVFRLGKCLDGDDAFAFFDRHHAT